MTLLELHGKVSQSTRPQLAMKMLLALVDNADLQQKNDWLSRVDMAEMTIQENGVLASHEKNVSRIGKELQSLELIVVRYRDGDGQLHQVSKKGFKTFYQASRTVLATFGRSWPPAS